MKHFIKLLLLTLLPSITFGQINGYEIADKPTGGTIIIDTLNKSSKFNLRQTTSGQVIIIPNLISGSKDIQIRNKGIVSVTLSPGGNLDTARSLSYSWMGTKWAVSAGSSSGSDNSKVNVSGDTMTGDLGFPSNKGNTWSSGSYIKDNSGDLGIHSNSSVLIESDNNEDININSSRDLYFLSGKNVVLDCDTTKITGKVKIVDGSQGLNKVLTSDANGNASWQIGIDTSLLLQKSNNLADVPNKAEARSNLGVDGTFVDLPTVGTIITEPWANTSAWTAVGTGTFSVSGGLLTCNGGSPASVTLSNYIKNTGYGPTMYNAWTASFGIKVGTINSTSWGIGFGIQSTNTFSAISVQVAIMLDATNKGTIRIYSNNSNSVIIAKTDSPISVSAGDSLAVKVKRVYQGFQCVITNTSLSPTQSATLTADQADVSGLGAITPNVGNFSLYTLGGTDHKVSALTVTSDQKVGNTLLCIGDSRANGAAASSPENSYPRVLEGMINGSVDLYCGAGCLNQHYIASEVLAMAPQYIHILSGTNDIGFSRTAAQATTDLQTFINALNPTYTLGINLFYSDEIPRADKDMSLVSNAYKTTIGTTGCIQTYRSFVKTGTAPDPTIFAFDGLHPLDMAHKKLAQIIEASIPISKRNRVLQNPIKPYFRNNGQLILGNATFNPRFALEAVASGLGNTSQIHITNSNNGGTDFTGGFISSTTSNQCALQGGSYFLNSALLAATTVGSTVGINIGTISFQTFSGATVGSAVTPLVRYYLDNNGNTTTNSTTSPVYRTTNAGSDLNAHFLIDPANSLTVGLGYGFSTSDGFFFTLGNATRRIKFASILPVSTTTTAGSEAGDLTFLTQSGGTAATEKFRITSGGGFTYNTTNTATGTTGAQTINKPGGTVNFAAGATTLVVTNSLATTSSFITVQVYGTDATAISARVTKASGSFTITLNAAATAETAVGFKVEN